VTVFLELSSSQDLTTESEGLVLPMYRALLARLEYAQTPKLAALEFDLETEGRLEAFEAAFAEVNGHSWRERRYTVLAVGEASAAMQAIDPNTFPSAETWSRDLEMPPLSAKWFVRRAIEMVERRGQGASRLVFVVDEVSQYIARSVERIRIMQGVAEEFQKAGGRLWLVATGQERLDEVVEGLEGSQSELIRLRARFPLTVDLLPSDIDEVVSRRVLDKRDEGRAEIAHVLAPHRQQLAANTRLASQTRSADPSEEHRIRLYPLVPYQVQLLIDAVNKRRSQVRTTAPMGGSARTLITHAQQLITSSKVGVGSEDVGALVTMDRSYDLLQEVIPTSWRAEIEQVSSQYGPHSTEVQIMKAVALVHDVPALALTADNLAVLLHPRVDAESRRDEIAASLGRLVTDDRLRETENGFQLQSAEQKRWDQERKQIAMGIGDELRLRRRLLTEQLRGLSVNHRRSFSVAVVVDGESRLPGEVAIDVLAVQHSDHRAEIRALSRESANLTRIFWIFDQSEDTRQALEELHRSDRMLDRHNVPSKSATDVQLLADETTRQSRAERSALGLLAGDLGRGEVIFQGQSEAPPQGDIRLAAQAIVRARLGTIYPRIERFAASLDPKDVLLVLRTEDLGTLPDAFGEDGIGLVAMTASGPELVTNRDPLAAFVDEVRRRSDFGHVPTGQVLERHFAAPPYGAPVPVIQALTAAAIRAGLVEVVYQGQRIGAAGDRRLDNVFRTLPAFRQTEIRLPHETGPDATTRSRLARRLQEFTGEPQSPNLAELARRVRASILPVAEPATEVVSTLRGAGLVVPAQMARARELIGRLRSEDDAEVVTTAAESWEDLVAGLEAIDALRLRLTEDLPMLVTAHQEVAAPAAEGEEAAKHSLADLLAAGDYVTHAGKIRSLTEELAARRRAQTDDLRRQLTQGLDAFVADLSGEFASVDALQRAQALRPLTDLVPPQDAGVETIKARIAQLEMVARAARRLLEELRSAGRLMEIRVADLIRRPIVSEPDVVEALAAIEKAIRAALADDKEVRLA
jgi:hypothetical protein